MEPSNPGASESEAAATQRHTSGYASLKFLEGRPKTSTKPAKRARVEAATAEPLRASDIVSQVVEADHGSPSWTGQNDDDGLFLEQEQAPPVQRPVASSDDDLVSSSNLIPEEFGKHVTPQGEQEAELLRQYRYRVAPWIDVGDPKSTFGIELLLETKRSRLLLETMLALTVQKNSNDRPKIARQLTESGFVSLRGGENVLDASFGPVQRAVSVLSMLQDLITSEPRQWRLLMMSHKLNYDSAQLNGFHTSLDEAILWVYFKVGKQISLIFSAILPLPQGSAYCLLFSGYME